MPATLLVRRECSTSHLIHRENTAGTTPQRGVRTLLTVSDLSK